MQLHKPPRQGESQTRSFILPACGGVELGKLLEQFRLILGCDPNAGVTDCNARIGAAIDDYGGSFVMDFETVLITATRLG